MYLLSHLPLYAISETFAWKVAHPVDAGVTRPMAELGYVSCLTRPFSMILGDTMDTQNINKDTRIFNMVGQMVNRKIQVFQTRKHEFQSFYVSDAMGF